MQTQPNQTTKAQISGAFTALAAMAETIRELGRVPSGTLYANVMGRMDFEAYTKAINLLKGADLVAEKSHELIWIGPTFTKETV